MNPLPRSFHAAAVALAVAPSLLAQPAAETNAAATDSAPVVLAPVTVIGSQADLDRLPGSGAVIPATEFRETGALTFNKIAARVPGVYVREEDGYGNFITVSIRGVDGNRSNKVTLMEDGILTAPSPYSAPAAYYSPKLGRMAGIEILKGSSQIAYGPHTTGGVINFLSTPVPDARSFYARTTYGTDNTLFNHTTFGESADLGAAGTAGYLLELHSQKTDGFRDIDGTSRNSGFKFVEPMIKLFWEPGTETAQRIELKVGYTNFDANESYTGLNEDDLRDDPDRRYAATQFDDLSAEHWRTYLKYIVQPTDALRIESALYYNEFKRTWDKLDGNIGQALLDPAGLALLQGLIAGNITTRAAYRDHEAMGWQTTATYSFETGDVAHRLNVGLRIHEDSATGTNQTTTYASTGTGGFGPGVSTPAVDAGNQEVTATALFAEHAVTVGRLTVTPGARYEYLDWTSVTGLGVRTTGDEEFYTAGLGLSYAIDAANTVFGGVYRGASVPNPASYSAGASEETSLGFELGLRHRREAFRSELVGFYTRVDDLLAPQIAVGGGGLTPTTNGGEAKVYGVEALLEYDFGRAQNWGVGLPVYFSATWTQAEFAGIDSRLGNGAGLFAGARNGNDIPYVPEWKLSSGVALVTERWTTRLDVSYVTRTWGTGYNGDTRVDDTTGLPIAPTAVDGRVDSAFIVDLTGHYDLTDNVRLIGGIQNLFDKRVITSRAPLGPRANAPRFIFGGAEVRF